MTRKPGQMTAPSPCKAPLERWLAMIGRVYDEIVDLLWQREQIRMIGKMINDNAQLLESDKSFLWEARRWYMVFAAMAVRRQSDRGEKLVSLAQLLSEMKAQPQCVTRNLIEERYRAHYQNDRDNLGVRLVEDDWKKWGDQATGRLNVQRLDADLDELHGASKDLLGFAGSTIAHTSHKALGKSFNITFDDLDNAIDVLERLTLDYNGLLTGRGGYSLTPTVQYDWYRQFTFAWRPRSNQGGLA